MIASACIATNLPPEAFGVPSSPALGAVMLTVLAEQQEQQELQAHIDQVRSRM